MKIFVNDRITSIKPELSAFTIRDMFKSDADIVVLNGFIIKEDRKLKENDRLVFIKRGEIPSQGEMEALLMARHTPGVFAKVKKAAVGIAGLGGLGSNTAISLARLGIGKLVLVDYDVVEPSNLNRQQYFISHIGLLKTEALRELIQQVNPFVELETKNTYLNADNVQECFSNADIIVEAFDDPKCKAELVNAALKLFPKKYVVASSGMAGYFSSNTIITKKISDYFYLIGDGESEAKPGCGLMAPRVAIAANHQANTVLRLILGEKDV